MNKNTKLCGEKVELSKPVNIAVIFDIKEFIANILGNWTSRCIHKYNKIINLSIAFILGLDSECVYFYESTGTKITKYY